MKTVAVISQKGGSGKTTLCIHLAVAAAQRSERVALVDLDPQASATEWHSHRQAEVPLLAQVSAAQLPTALKKCEAAGVQLAIVDTAPHSNPEAVKAAKLSDYLLIPCRPTILDLRAIAPSVDIAVQTRRPAAIVFCACPPLHGETEVAIVREAREAVTEYKLQIYPGQISQRVAFAHALIDGRAVTEFEPSGKAAQEIFSLHKWLSKELTHV